MNSLALFITSNFPSIIFIVLLLVFDIVLLRCCLFLIHDNFITSFDM